VERRHPAWHRCLGHPAFKAVIALAESRAVITDLPAKIPGLDACVACVAVKSAHLPQHRQVVTMHSHQHGRSNASKVSWRK